MSRGDVDAQARVWSLLHAELLEQARRRMSNGSSELTIQATQLVGIAYERIARLEGKAWESREHFLAVASLAMRSALVDHVRRRRIRPGTEGPLDTIAAEVEARVGDLIEFNDVLDQFSELDPEMGRALEMRAIGFPMGTIAETLQIPPRTFYRRFDQARAQLFRMLN